MNTFVSIVIYIVYLALCLYVGKMLPEEIYKRKEFIFPSPSHTIAAFQKSAAKKKPKALSKNSNAKDTGKYIWDNSTYYSTICHEFLNKHTNSTPKLAFQFTYGGFGNQLYSLLTTSLMAVVGDYHLYYIYPHYNKIFDGCYVDDILKKNEIIEYKVNCTPYTNCFRSKHSYWDIHQAIGHEDTLISGLLMDPKKIFMNPVYLQELQNIFGVVGKNMSMWDIRKTMLRLILNPESKLRNQLLLEKKQLFKHAHTVGLQLRMGGNISDAPEKYVGIPFSRIDEVIDQLRACIKKKGWEGDVQVYISSDSSKTIKYIQEKTKDEFPIIESMLYKHGHTSSFLVKNEYVNVMKKVVSDLYYMSICDYSIISWPSSLGRLMCFLGEEDQCEAVLGWEVEDKRVNIQYNCLLNKYCYTGFFSSSEVGRGAYSIF